MRCSKCKAYIAFDSKLKECPACGSPIDRKPYFEDMLNMLAELAADKNFIFWGIMNLIFWAAVGGVEFALGGGQLLNYFEQNLFYSLILFVFWGFIVELIVKANAQIRIASKTVILKERRSLRMFRLGTNLSLLGGLALSVIWVGIDNFFSHFPGITLVTISVICTFWAIEGMYFREEHFEDHRVRNFFILLGVRHPHPYRVMSAWYLSGITIAAIAYFGLIMFPSIFNSVYNTWFIQSSIKAIKGFLDYFPTI
ncbi:MAG: hypothetical protein HQ591_01355 [candidate division Zixibacteria bacterium]|nr:hypothetical protein [Candidatus Tariuqbacter arcticus]